MRSESKALRFDPRTKLFAVLLCGAFTFLVNETGLMLLFGVAACYLLVLGMYKKTAKFLLGFGFLFGLQYVIYTYLTGAAAIFGFIVFMAVRFVPVLMAVSALSAAAPGELIAALQKLHIPKAVIIPLAVGLRFMPVVAREFSAIRDAMRLHGLSLASLNTLAHPVMALEYVLVPLLMRSMKISDELAASASARGIDNPGPRTCLRQLHCGLSDGIALMVFSAAGLAVGLFFI